MVLLIQINMLMVVVMLINMLIAQLSYRCETAQENAELQYDIDKSLMVAKLEQSRFNRHVSFDSSWFATTLTIFPDIGLCTKHQESTE